MKIAIIGYGKMGQMIERDALEKGHQVVAIIDPKVSPLAISESSLADAEICFEFTHPESAVPNILQLAELKKSCVVGTTGWELHMDKVKESVGKHKIGLFYASNFSLGMNLFVKTLKDAARNFLVTNLYDVAGIETHHNQKLDAPSGSAKMLAKAIEDSVDGAVTVPFSSVRIGHVPGTHTVLFDSEVDTITLTHQARTAAAFVQGALLAATWLKGKVGFFTMEDLLYPNNFKIWDFGFEKGPRFNVTYDR